MSDLKDLVREAIDTEVKSIVAEVLDLWLRDERADPERLKAMVRKLRGAYERSCLAIEALEKDEE
jgi:hypothetical protein